ncbi:MULTISPECIES: hypothetical protein [Niastella]|uniref:Lipoprotein n=1 Tax=Niastella soli TaxID=2821487 RepID=A0ABS3Z4S6_9BACT|nr:hypothetical protein [Niastella soli]MBO9204386.1 hypothetical protein [Niastella soli]
MKFKILIPVLVVTTGIVLYSCSKDTQTPTPDDTVLSTYYPGSTMEVKELSIRTKNGAVTDPALIQDFINRNVTTEAKANFFVGMSTVPVASSTQALKFLNNNRVNVNGVNMEITGTKDSVQLVTEYTSTPFPVYATSCGALLGHVPQYSAFSDCPDANCATYRKTYPLIMSGANYYAPLLTYAVVTKDCAITATEVPAINIINPDLQSLLNEGDSVLVQYVKLPLTKKVD